MDGIVEEKQKEVARERSIISERIRETELPVRQSLTVNRITGGAHCVFTMPALSFVVSRICRLKIDHCAFSPLFAVK